MSLVQEMVSVFQSYQTQGKVTRQRTPLRVEYHLALLPSPDREIDHWLSIQLKVGDQRLYVVKSVREFLRAFEQHQTMTFTKNFVYEPDQFYVTSDDQTVFEFLLNFVESERMYRYLFDPWSSQHIHDRSILIPPHQVGDFLKCLPKQRTILQVDRQSDWLGDVVQKCPIVFFLFQKERQFYLQSFIRDLDQEQHDPSQLFLLSRDGYCYANGKIYQLREVQRKLILPLHRNIQAYCPPQLTIPSHQMGYVASVILPILKKETQLSMDDAIIHQMAQHPLEVSIYFDRQWVQEKERLTAKIGYTYGDHVVDPFQEIEEEEDGRQIIVRDIKTEQEVMDYFEQSQFKYNGRELYLEDEEAIFDFLHEQFPRLEKIAKIEMTQTVEELLLSPKNQLVSEIELDPTYHWLEVRFELPNATEEELQKLMQAMIDKKRYYRFPSGAFVPLYSQIAQSLHSFQQEKAIKIEGNHIKIPALRGMQMEAETGERGVIRKGQRFRQMLQNMKNPEQLDLEPPASIGPVLRDYQRLGFQWLKTLSRYRFGGILADDMGLGKTIQVIALIISQQEEQRESSIRHRKEIPALVVVPSSLIYNWQKECARFAPQLKTVIVHGEKEKRRKLLIDPPKIDLMITSYPLLQRDIDWYSEYVFDTLILDEAQYFKNQRTQTAQAAKKIQASTCFALSGTPIENNLDELFSICDIVLPGLFANQRVFRKCSPEQIAKRIRPFILRRLKQDVLDELPDKMETIQLLDLTTEQKKVYLAFLKKMKEEAKQWIAQGDFQKHRMQILAGLTRLRQICCHPSLFIEEYKHDSGKFTFLLDLLEELLQNQHRILIFSQFTKMLSLIREELTRRGHSYHYLDGGVPSQKRLEMVERFNGGEKDLFLISLKAGGTGLNLTGADTVIFYDLWWNPAVEQQATDRAYRMGQKKKVQVIRLISQGTIEEKIYELHQKKKKLVEQVIQPSEQTLISLNEEEIREILGV